MKKLLLIVVLVNFLSGCVAVVAGAAGATIANPKGVGQTVTKAGEAVRNVGKKPTEKSE